MRNDLFTQVLDFSYVQIIKVPGEVLISRYFSYMLMEMSTIHTSKQYAITSLV